MGQVAQHTSARGDRRSTVPATTALAYVRKSTVEVERRSLTEQEADLRREAESRGFTVMRVLAEEASAYAERERPVFQRALQAVERGEAEVILCWSLDRFSRRGAGHVMGLIDKGLRLVTLEGLDSATEDGRLAIAVMAEAARRVSTGISRSVKRSKRTARSEGRWHAGRAPYGYRTEGRGLELRLVVQASESAVIREMADRVIRGDSISSVTGWLNDSGVPTPSANGRAWKAKGMGTAWRNMTVKAVLKRPTLAGWLPHEGDVVRHPDGQPVVSHEAILQPHQWRRVQSALQARTAVASDASRAAGGRPPSRLLSGLLHCHCGHVLSAKAPGFSCSAPRGLLRGGAEHVTVRSTAEDIVARKVLRHLAALEPGNPTLLAVAEAWGVLNGRRDDSERLLREDAVETAKDEVDRVVRLVAKGLLDDADAERTLPDLRAAVRRAEARLAELGPPETDTSFILDLAQQAQLPEADPIANGGAWAALSQEARRKVVQAAIERIDVLPTYRGARDVERRLLITWRTDQQEAAAA